MCPQVKFVSDGSEGSRKEGSEMRMRDSQRPEQGGSVALVKKSAFVCM